MLKDSVRARVLQFWFAAVALAAVSTAAFGSGVSAGTASTLLVMCLVPPAIVLLLWPAEKVRTVSGAFQGVDRRA